MGKQNVAAPEKGDAATLESATLQLAPPGAGGDDTQDLALISAESDQLDWLNEGNNFSITAGIFNTLGGVTHALPNNTIGAIFNSTTWGGSNLGQAFNSVGSLFSTLASNAGFQANKSSIIGGHQRRLDEWRFQSNTAAREIQQIDKQMLANEIRIQIATDEITNHDKQIEDSNEVDEFMHDKFTNQQLYSWMVGQISSVYFRTYQMAYHSPAG
jgi:Tc toxin complex TcA C-terminal TcB-binding domain